MSSEPKQHYNWVRSG